MSTPMENPFGNPYGDTPFGWAEMNESKNGPQHDRGASTAVSMLNDQYAKARVAELNEATGGAYADALGDAGMERMADSAARMGEHGFWVDSALDRGLDAEVSPEYLSSALEKMRANMEASDAMSSAPSHLPPSAIGQDPQMRQDMARYAGIELSGDGAIGDGRKAAWDSAGVALGDRMVQPESPVAEQDEQVSVEDLNRDYGEALMGKLEQARGAAYDDREAVSAALSEASMSGVYVEDMGPALRGLDEAELVDSLGEMRDGAAKDFSGAKFLPASGLGQDPGARAEALRAAGIDAAPDAVLDKSRFYDQGFFGAGLPEAAQGNPFARETDGPRWVGPAGAADGMSETSRGFYGDEFNASDFPVSPGLDDRLPEGVNGDPYAAGLDIDADGSVARDREVGSGGFRWDPVGAPNSPLSGHDPFADLRESLARDREVGSGGFRWDPVGAPNSPLSGHDPFADLRESRADQPGGGAKPDSSRVREFLDNNGGSGSWKGPDHDMEAGA